MQIGCIVAIPILQAHQRALGARWVRVGCALRVYAHTRIRLRSSRARRKLPAKRSGAGSKRGARAEAAEREGETERADRTESTQAGRP